MASSAILIEAGKGSGSAFSLDGQNLPAPVDTGLRINTVTTMTGFGFAVGAKLQGIVAMRGFADARTHLRCFSFRDTHFILLL